MTRYNLHEGQLLRRLTAQYIHTKVGDIDDRAFVDFPDELVTCRWRSIVVTDKGEEVITATLEDIYGSDFVDSTVRLLILSWIIMRLYWPTLVKEGQIKEDLYRDFAGV